MLEEEIVKYIVEMLIYCGMHGFQPLSIIESDL